MNKINSLTSYNQAIFPSAHFLGTNCFVLGSQHKRILVDTGSCAEVDPTFIIRLNLMMQKYKFEISTIFLTQGNIFHAGGT